MSNPELRIYNFRKPLNGKASGEVIHLRDNVVAVDLGDVIVKISKADFWHHVQGEVDNLVLGREYLLNHPLEGTEYWTPIWEEPSWEGPVIVVQDRDKNLKRITLEEFWEYARFLPSEDDFDSKTWINKTFLFAEPLEGSHDYVWKGDSATPQGLALVSHITHYAYAKPQVITRKRFLRAVEANTRLPVPPDEVLDAWLTHYPGLRRSALLTFSFFGGAAVVAAGVGKFPHFVLAREHYQALLLRIEKTSPPEKVVKAPAKAIVRDSSDTSYYDRPEFDRACDSNHYESPGRNPGSGGGGSGNDDFY
jgi:hypothetical protein